MNWTRDTDRTNCRRDMSRTRKSRGIIRVTYLSGTGRTIDQHGARRDRSDLGDF